MLYFLQFYTGKNGLDGVTNLSLAGASRYDASGKIVLGFDLGWAFGISPSGNDGGLYWKPMVGYNLSDKKLLTLSYNAVRKDKITIANIGFGIMFNM